MPVSQPFAFAGALQLAADQSLPNDPIPFNGIGTFTSMQKSTLNLTGAGTLAVPFGSVVTPGAQGIFLRYASGQTGAAPIELTLNAADKVIEVSPGGLFLYFNPTPAAGITSLSITYTAACQVEVWIFA